MNMGVIVGSKESITFEENLRPPLELLLVSVRLYLLTL